MPQQAKAYGKEQRQETFEGRSNAPPEVVYDLLADLNSHLEWGGNRQYKQFRLLSVDAPKEPARVGSVFTSTGTIPMLRTRWQNTTTVTKAERPGLFETTTEGHIPWKRGAPGGGTFVNRFEIAPDGTGSRVRYQAIQQRFRNPPFGLRYPIMRNMTYRIMIPAWYRRGFKKMLQMADERAAAKSN